MMVWANQLLRSSGPSTVSLKSFCALIWSSQLIGGMRRSAPTAAVLKASVTSASARSPPPEVSLPSRIAYQRPISSSRALSCATRLRSLSRARNAGYRQAAYLRSCAIPHRMIWNFIAESMVSSSPGLRAESFLVSTDRATFSAVCSACAISKRLPGHRVPGRYHRYVCSARARLVGLVRLDAGNLNHVRPFLDIGAQIFLELGGTHHQRHRALLVPGLLHVHAGNRFVDLRIEFVDDRLWRAGGRHD